MGLRVLLADDQLAVRSALRLVLEQEPDVDVVGEVAEGEQLLAQVGAARPDLLLLDWELPGLPVADLLSALQLLCPGIRVVALSGRPEARGPALETGARAFVSKGDPPELLLAIIADCRCERERRDESSPS
ncbi:MAG TPA: response regulator transcription factor [Solirubrobacterales bacterium]